MNDEIKITGKVELELRDGDGKLKSWRIVRNLVVNAGLVAIAERLVDAQPSNSPFNYMALGLSSTPAAPGDTTLGAEIAGSRTLDSSTTAAGKTAVYACTFGAGVGVGAVSEAGLFNDPLIGTMLAHVVFSQVAKTAPDTLTITWTLSFGVGA
jgi:hypothetical protein